MSDPLLQMHLKPDSVTPTCKNEETSHSILSTTNGEVRWAHVDHFLCVFFALTRRPTFCDALSREAPDYVFPPK